MERPSIRVLHVEDNEFFAAVAADVLEAEADITVRTETDGSTALQRLESDEFDCVVSDYEMDGMDGLELLESIRDRYPEMPFILLTGGGNEETASEAISAGVTDYLQKGDGKRQFAVLANRIENAVMRRRAEKSADRQIEINQLFWDVSQSLLQATSREEMERAVCERLAGSESYHFTWIGNVDEDGNVIPTVSAGVERGYLDSIYQDGEEGNDDGPVVRAVETQEIQLTQNIATDPEFERWRDRALERGYHSKAAIPLCYEGRVYGVLNVYADYPYAFDDGERRILTKFGNSIAYAMNSVRTRQELVRREQRLQVFNRILRHNLRNDLNVVLGHAQNLAEAEPTASESVEVIKRKASDLIDISEKAREVGKILENESPDRRQVDVTSIVERTVEELQDRYPEADLSADFPDAAWVYGDNRLDAVVDELVENAIEHNDVDVPEVSVSVNALSESDDGTVEITVTDDGPGIPEEERAVLLEGRETPLHHGSGLGLWLANWVVGKFGGDLEFGHNQPRGSVVTICLKQAETPARS
jgi:signal transduction histidine kinase